MSNIKNTLPIAIVLGCLIIGAFYYASEKNKQDSIERQVKMKIDQEAKEKQDQQFSTEMEKVARMDCSDNAEFTAQKIYKDSCTKDNYCTYKEGYYYMAQYNNLYSACLKSKGLSE